jgi:Lar family restriction alleviation protein
MAEVTEHLDLCPFCGSSEYHDEEKCLNVVSDGENFQVYCLCGASGPVQTTRGKAIEAWNARASCRREQGWNPFRLSERIPGAVIGGNIESLGLATLLQMLSLDRKTGVLKVVRNGMRRAICLKDGQVIAATGDERSRLGEILSRKGLLSGEQLTKALETALHSHKPLGEVLISLGIIDPLTLTEVIREQVQEAIFDLFLWGEGDFEYEDCEIGFNEGVREVNMMQLVLETVRRVDESIPVRLA